MAHAPIAILVASLAMEHLQITAFHAVVEDTLKIPPAPLSRKNSSMLLEISPESLLKYNL